MTLTQLKYILAVDKHRHFGRAAKSVHVAQPTLSVGIAKLEEYLGVIIFDRSRSTILPTSAGEKILKKAQTIIKQMQALENLASEVDGEISGNFKLGIIPTLAPFLVPQIVKTFGLNYPKVQLEIQEIKTEDIISLLDKDRLDAGLLATPLGEDFIVERALYYEPFLVYVHEDHPLANKDKIKASDIDLKDLWVLSEGHCFRNQVLNLCTPSQKQVGQGHWSFQSGSLETLVNLVDQCGGLTLLPKMVSKNLPKKSKRLKEFVGNPPVREVGLVYSRLFLKEPIIDAIEKSILDSLPEGIFSPKAFPQKATVLAPN
ncbi:MAG: LysR family transcriptional regulator [Bacteriovoracaceae bacterium]|jgi:LysR family transcriptional regulator, hydrogen peroxide-inducible genes activator|nr:LysR family transcriptional regulator [Bacteriovoracaceae bacterium]